MIRDSVRILKVSSTTYKLTLTVDLYKDDDMGEQNAKENTYGVWIWRLIRLPLVIYIGLIITLVIFENQIVYQPDVETGDNAEDSSVSGRHRYINSGQHKIHLMVNERPNPRCYALYFHGNGGNIRHRRLLLDRIASELNATVVGVSYSGYGFSDGKPNQRQLQLDAEAALSYILQYYEIEKTEVMLFGESLGGAIATRLASDHELSLIALDSTFTSLSDVAQHHYPWLPVKYLMRNRFPVKQYAQTYFGAVVQTHGTGDQVVPFQLGHQLALQFPNQDNHQFLVRQGGRHNEVPPDSYFRALDVAIKKLF